MCSSARAFVVVVFVHLGCGVDPPPPADPFDCIEGWPVAADVPAAAPLAVAPGVVWTQAFAEFESPPYDQLPLTDAGSRIIVSLRAGMAVFDRTTGQRLARPVPPLTVEGTVSYSQPALAADTAGNLYGIAKDAYALDAAGATRWQVGIEANIDWGGEFHRVHRPPVVLGPDGLVFVLGGERLHALRTGDGSQAWSLVGAGAFAGAGPVLVGGSEVRRASDGQLLGHVRSSRGTRLQVWALAGFGFVGWHGDPQIVEAVDRCDQVLWSLPAGSSSFLYVHGVGPAGMTYLNRRARASVDGPYTLMTVSAQGTIQATATTDAGLVAIGADGTAYLQDCSKQPFEIVALGPELEPLWRLAIEGTCPSAALLADGGLMFLLTSVGAEYRLIAVQTTSPGLARTGWNAASHDSRATRWLLP